MTHLTPDQFVDALDGALPSDRQAHLEVCDVCRAEVAALRSAMALAQSDAPIEPSPLFWDHLESRVHDAVGAAAVPPASHRWWTGWRVATAAAAAMAALGLAGWMQWASRVPDTTNQIGVGFNVAQALPDGLSPAAAGEAGETLAPPSEAGSAATSAGRGSAAAWQSVVKRAAEIPADDALVTPALTGSAVTLEQLSQRELREFVRLLKAEMGGM
jgi:hypothetical protein